MFVDDADLGGKIVVVKVFGEISSCVAWDAMSASPEARTQRKGMTHLDLLLLKRLVSLAG